MNWHPKLIPSFVFLPFNLSVNSYRYQRPHPRVFAPLFLPPIIFLSRSALPSLCLSTSPSISLL